LWEYAHAFERDPDVSLASRLRSIAVGGDKVILATPHAHLVALDARTGKVVWDHTVADEKLGYRYTSGPIVVRGTIVAGMTGCER
jgi:alcohol dehydrogenase (cytochrome c)